MFDILDFLFVWSPEISVCTSLLYILAILYINKLWNWTYLLPFIIQLAFSIAAIFVLHLDLIIPH